MTPWRLLVYAIVAAALLWVFYYHFLPYFFHSTDAVDEMEKMLVFAEGSLGKTASKEIEFPEGIILNTKKQLDNDYRVVRLECTSAADCGLEDRIELDARKAVFKKKTKINTSYRCALENGLYTCTVFFGRKPAQIELQNAVLPEIVEDAGEKISFDLVNSGEFNLIDTTIKTKIFNRFMEEGQWITTLFEELPEQMLGMVEPGKKQPVEIALPDELGSGNYRLESRVEALQGGFEVIEKDFEVSTDARASACKAADFGETISEEGQFKTALNCSECNYSYECVLAWNEKIEGKTGYGEIEAADPKNAFLFSSQEQLENFFKAFNVSCEKKGYTCMVEGEESICKGVLVPELDFSCPAENPACCNGEWVIYTPGP